MKENNGKGSSKHIFQIPKNKNTKTQKLNKMESTLYEEHNSSHPLKHLNTKGSQTCRTVFKKDSDLHDYMTKTQLSAA